MHQVNPPSSASAAGPVNDPATEKTAITVLLTWQQVATLDQISVFARQATGTALNRSALIRAMITALMPPYDSWSRCRSEAELAQLIGRRYRGQR